MCRQARMSPCVYAGVSLPARLCRCIPAFLRHCAGTHLRCYAVAQASVCTSARQSIHANTHAPVFLRSLLTVFLRASALLPARIRPGSQPHVQRRTHAKKQPGRGFPYPFAGKWPFASPTRPKEEQYTTIQLFTKAITFAFVVKPGA